MVMTKHQESALPKEAIDVIWEQQRGYLSALNQMIEAGPETLGSYLEKIGASKMLFRSGVLVAACMDEGAAPCLPDGSPVAAVRSAGAGILAENMEAAVRQIENFGDIQTVVTHQECGAARVAVARAFGLSDEQAVHIKYAVVDNYAWCWGKQLAAELSRRHGKYVAHKHLSLDEMTRPANLHMAVCAYYDGMGNFNRVGIPDLPRGFVISRLAMPSDRGIANLEVAAGIAMGPHGFGERFSRQNPFNIVCIGNPDIPELTTQALMCETEQVVGAFDGRVAVTGFDAILVTEP